MADLKLGTTVGGSIVWHQGNFPLKAVSDDLYFKTYKVYTEKNKPQAVDNDFVSKKDGGAYLKAVDFTEGLNILDSGAYKISISKNTVTNPMFAYTAKMRIKGTFAYETEEGQPFILFNPSKVATDNRLTVMGNILAGKVYDESGRTFSPGNPPTPTDVSLGNVTNDAQVKLNFVGVQTMKGPLTLPSLNTQTEATEPTQVPQLKQVILKGVIIDFGTF